MKTINTCCGANIQRKAATHKKLPANPVISKGMDVIYIGAGDFKIRSKIRDAVYYASDHRRHFKIYADDAGSVLANPNIILKP